MVESITFKDDVKTTNYLAVLPCLKGKTFAFKHGLNVLCGYNGCGKSSIITAIRKMTFCDRKRHSEIQRSDFASMHVNDVANKFYGLIDLQNDWSKSVFSLRPDDEIDGVNFTDDGGTFGQFFEQKTISAGMNTFFSLSVLVKEVAESAPGKPDEKLRDFRKNCMETNLACYGTVTIADSEESDEGIGRVKKYINAHNVENKGITALLDEPDRSADVMLMDSIYGLLVKFTKSTDSFIVVLHNTGLVYRLVKELNDKINWIELTPGYLDNIVNFIEGKPVNRVSPWWLHPRYTEGN